MHHGARRCGIAARRRSELRGRRTFPAVDLVVGDPADLATIPVLFCSAGDYVAAAVSRSSRYVAAWNRNKLQQLRLRNCRGTTGPDNRGLFCTQGNARCVARAQCFRVDGIGSVFADDLYYGSTSTELE